MGTKSAFNRGAIAEVWRLLKQGIEIPPNWDTSLHDELRELAHPYIVILMYKRAKFDADERWTVELKDFIETHLWPHLKDSPLLNGRSQSHLAELMDDIVAAEQRRERVRERIMPLTSRFDTSWAA